MQKDKNNGKYTGEMEELAEIAIHGARENNLKNINLTIPRDKFVVITGISGSGKSSMAFDTIYAEGQRRYIECLSSYAKQFMGMMKKPDVDSIEGLSPAISIEQKTTSNNPRSTVGTTTEIYDYLRLLFAKIGVQHCVQCNIPVVKKTAEQIINEIFNDFKNEKILILAPLITGRKGHYKELFITLLNQGFTRVRIDGNIEKITSDLQLSRYKIHDIELVVDKCTVTESHRNRIQSSCELAINRSDGNLMIMQDSDSKSSNIKLFSTNYSCPKCHKSYRKLTPNMFSFNSTYGACPTCNGLGEVENFDADLLIPDKSISIIDGAIEFLGKQKKSWFWTQIEKYANEQNIDLSIPVSQMPENHYHTLLFGQKDGEENDRKNHKQQAAFPGFIPNLTTLYNNVFDGIQQKDLYKYRRREVCTACAGSRLKAESNFVKIYGSNIDEIVSLDIAASVNFFNKLMPKLNHVEKQIAEVIIKEVIDRLNFLQKVGLSYIFISRPMYTLSGGEAQRIRLASQIGSQLVGITYVLDEPSIGLHQHDNDKLIESLKQLRDFGNTIIVVEHDKAMIEQSDYIIDFGKGAGIHGGEVLFATDSKNIHKLPSKILDKSLTAQYLNKIKDIEISKDKRLPNNEKKLILKGAKGHNLKNIDLHIPLGLFICITGMSGSGKSSLINDTLFPILSNHLHNANRTPLEYDQIIGLEHVDKVIEIDQTPIGRTPRSNPATYSKIFDIIREQYAMLPEASIRGYKAGRFSFNLKGGRCEACEGAGIKKLEMNFLPDVYVKCDTCNGKRYNEETLQIKFKDKSVADVLDMTVEEAVEFFRHIPKLNSKLQVLNDVGLGYIKLGQQAPTLSGGEAQRVKLAAELSRPASGKTIFLLDEPTTGLHFEDIRLLVMLLQRLADKGNTIIVIEHNLDVIKCADWVIDLGPEGGENGGKIIAEGTPQDIARCPLSLTGRYLQPEIRS